MALYSDVDNMCCGLCPVVLCAPEQEWKIDEDLLASCYDPSLVMDSDIEKRRAEERTCPICMMLCRDIRETDTW